MSGTSARPPRWVVLTAALAGAFMAYLDATVVNVAFPSIQASFPGVERSTVAWVLDAYYIFFAAFLIPSGRLADLLGRKRVFGAGVLVFGLASAACALAPSAGALIAFRAVQGIGAAMLGPASLALILLQFPAARRATAVSLWGGAAALAAALGPPIGGVLVEVGDWRVIFLLNLPIVVGVLVLLRRVEEWRDPQGGALPSPLDTLALVAGVGLITLGISQSHAWGWDGPRPFAALGGGACALLLLAVRVRRRADADAPPVLRVRPFALANAATLLFGLAFYALLFANVLFLTTVWQYSIFEAGVAITPISLMTAVVALPAGRLADRFGYRVPVLPGIVLFAAGVIWLVERAGTQPDFTGTWLPGALAVGAGVGFGLPSLATAAVESLPERFFGIANAMNATFRQVGAALGVAGVVSILDHVDLTAPAHPFRQAWTFIAITALAALPFAAGISSRNQQGVRMLRRGRDLQDKVVVITGGSRGMGRATAERFAAAGARVAIGARDGAAAAAVAAEIGGGTQAFAVDVVDRASVEAFVTAVTTALGPIDVFVNNAGVMLVGPFEDESDDNTQHQIDVNLLGVINGMKAAISHMEANGGGHVINTVSAVGVLGLPGCATYSAAKHGVVGLCEAVRNELRGRPIDLSIVLPIPARTELTSGVGKGRFVRWLEPTEIADAIVKTARRPRYQVYVPRWTNPVNRLLYLVPQPMRDASGRLFKADQLLKTTDFRARTGYETAAVGTDGPTELAAADDGR